MGCSMTCATQDELSERAMAVLEDLFSLVHRQIEVLKNSDNKIAHSLDENIELLIGEKERAFGALRQHRDEHGC